MLKIKEKSPARYQHLKNFNLREVAPEIFRIDVLYPSPGRTCCYLLVHEDSAALVDCGANRGADAAMTVLKEKAIPPEKVKWLIITHPHLDHAGGAGRLMQLLPKAVLAGHSSTIKHLTDPHAALVPGAKHIYDEDFYNTHYGTVEAVPPQRAHALTNGEHLMLGLDRAIRAVYSPGHAWNHISFYDEQSAFLFCGDAYGISYPELNSAVGKPLLFPTTTPTQFDVAAAEKTVQTLHGLRPKQLGLAHFGSFAADDIPAEQLLKALHDWPVTAETLYDEEPADFHPRMVAYLLDWMTSDVSADKKALAHDYLRPDAVLNAHGFEHWVKKRHAPAT